MDNIQFLGTLSTNNSLPSTRRLDSANIAMFAENMTQIGTVQEALKADLVLHNMIPYKQVARGADIYKYAMYESGGVAAYNANQASDIPLVNRIGNEFLARLIEVRIGMQVSEHDIEAALYSNSDHVNQLRNQCLRAIYEAHENTLLNGYKPQGLKGLFDFDNGATAVANNWYDPGTTSQQIIADIVAAYSVIDKATISMIKPNVMLISPSLYTLLQLRPALLGTTYINMSTLNYITSELQLEVKPIPKMNLAFRNKTRDGFFLIANNSRYLEHPISIVFDTTEPQKSGFNYNVYCRSRHAGLVSYHPRSIIARQMAAEPV